MIHFPETPERNEALLRWAGVRIKEWQTGIVPRHYVCLGISVAGKMTAVVIYHDLRPGAIQLSIAADNPRWCTRGNLTEILTFPFEKFKIERVESYANAENKRVRRLLKWCGFTEEGKLRKGSVLGGDLFVYSLLKDELNGQERWRHKD